MYDALAQYEIEVDEANREFDLQPHTCETMAEALKYLDKLSKLHPGYPLYLAVNPIANGAFSFEVWGDGSNASFVAEHDTAELPF